MADRWPHQTQGTADILDALARGERRVLVTSPTGGGKTVVMQDVAQHFLDVGQKVILYTNRRWLVEQTVRHFAAAGVGHGVRAAGWAEDLDERFQISSLQTEYARVIKGGTWGLHEADIALVDEAHAQKAATAKIILDAHVEQGASYVGFTATPLGLAGLYEMLIAAGTPSQLRRCGALVPCLHYGPDEPDLRSVGRFTLGEDLTEAQQVKAMMVPGIFGRVVSWYRRLNPEQRPTILFAPGVGESVFFAEQFQREGIAAAHVDGRDVWVGGKWYKADRGARNDVLRASEAGEVQVLCNRYVLREGINAPWLAHGILATVFGHLGSYLQAGGRLLRAHPGLESVTVQDHGGNWWRHGSLNANRDWSLDLTGPRAAALREEGFRNKEKPEPACCPRCRMILTGSSCPCGWHYADRPKSRLVIEADGSERYLEGDIYKPRQTARHTAASVRAWVSVYWRAHKSGLTFRQAEALFAKENNWQWPPRNFPLMPTQAIDWLRKVHEVSQSNLTQEGGV